MPLPDPSLLTADYLKAHKAACDEYYKRGRFHPLVKMLEDAIVAGELPVRSLRPTDSLFHHRGSGAFSFRGLDYRDYPEPAVIINLDIHIYRGDEGDEITGHEWYSLPASLLVPKPCAKTFKAWCAGQHDLKVKRLLKESEEAAKRAKEARKPVKPGSHSSWC